MEALLWDTHGFCAPWPTNLRSPSRLLFIKLGMAFLASSTRSGSDDGRRVYYGPRRLAKDYSESLGFVCPSGVHVADFLTSVGVPSEPQIKPGFEHAPKTAEVLEHAYLPSAIARAMDDEALDPSHFAEHTVTMESAFKKGLPKNRIPLQSSYKIGLRHRIIAYIVKQL